MPEEQNNQQPVQNDRTKRVEDFLLDPDKVMFETLEEFQTAIQGLTDMLAGVNIAELERLQGEDGVTPERGVNYFNDADLDAIEEFILEQVPRVGFEVPSPEQVQDYIKNAVAKVPRIKGDKGVPGKDGEDGKDGSPDSGTDIIKKLRKLDKNQRLKMSDIRGLENTLRSHREGLEEVEELKKLVEGIRVAIPSMENIQATANWGDITGDITNQTDLQAILDTKLEDAPSDGKTYGRKDGAWEEVTGGGGGGTWGSITGTLSDQTDLQNALNAKYDASNPSGFISDLSGFDTDDLAEGATNKYNATHTGDATGATSLSVVALRGVSLDATVGSPTDGKILVYRSAGSDWVLEDKPTSTGNPAWGDITGTLASQTDLQAALDDKFDEPTGTTSQYIRGDGSLATFPTIPSGTVTSVAASVPTGFSISGSPITSSGTLAITYAAGYQGYTSTEATKLSGIEAGADVTDATNVLAAGAVMTTGDQSIAGIKTFTSFPVTPSSAPTTDYQVANKKYVDDNAGGSLTVQEVGDTPITGVTHINFDGATVIDNGSGEVTIEVEGVAGDTILDLTELTTPAGADNMVIVDDTDSTTKRITLTNLASFFGDVKGPSSATDNAITRFDTTTGKLIQNSNATIDDNGVLTASSFIPSSSTAPTNGMYLPAANTLGWAINGTGEMRLTGTALSPNANDGNALGTTSLSWSDLFLASGAIINIANSNWVATHTSGVLTVGTGDLRVSNAGSDGASVLTLSGSQAPTNKDLSAASNTVINKTTITSSSTPTPTGDRNINHFSVTALAASATFAAPSGTPAEGNRITMRIHDNGTSRALSWNAIYTSTSNATLPTTTVIGKELFLGFLYDSTDSVWRLVAITSEL